MALISGLAGVLGRFAGRLLNSSLGWATVLLFGKVSGRKQTVLLLIALASVLEVVLVVGIVFPDLGTTLIAFVPAPSFVSRDLIRLAMLVAAIALPLVVGIAAIVLTESSKRPHGGGLVVALLRGYPFTIVLALTIAVLAVIATVRKIQSLTRRWEDAHIAVIVKPGGYDEVVAQLESVLRQGGIPVEVRPAPAVLSVPPKLLAATAGEGLGSLVPDRLALIKAEGLEALIYPSDISLGGTHDRLALARALIATQLTHAPAYLTTAAEAQTIEDELRELSTGGAGADAPAPDPRRARERFAELDRRLMQLTIPFDEWEIVYRERLQVERTLRDGEAPLEGGRAGAAIGAASGARPSPSDSSRPVALRPDERPTLADRVLAVAAVGLVAVDAVLFLVDRVLGRRR